MKYFNEWKNQEDVEADFLDYGEYEGGKRLAGFPTDHEILFASYEQGGYDGDSIVLFKRDGKLFYNSAGHCSCFGLEGQWEPEEVIPEQLMQFDKPSADHGDEAKAAWLKIMGAGNV